MQYQENKPLGIRENKDIFAVNFWKGATEMIEKNGDKNNSDQGNSPIIQGMFIRGEFSNKINAVSPDEDGDIKKCPDPMKMGFYGHQ